MSGVAFRAELDFEKLRFWFPVDQKKHVIRTEDLKVVRVLSNGYTKLVVRFRKDMVVPTTREESIKLVSKLNGLLAEIRAVGERRRLEGKRAADRFYRNRAGSVGTGRSVVTGRVLHKRSVANVGEH